MKATPSPRLVPKLTFAPTPRLLLAVALSSASAALPAADLNFFAPCTLVPSARFTSSGNVDTVVGFTAQRRGRLFWFLFDEDGDRLDRGDFLVEDTNVLVPFSVAQVASPELANRTAIYLLACLDNNDNDNGDGNIDFEDEAALAGNAFEIDIATNDVAFIPTIDIAVNNLDPDVIGDDLDDIDEDPVRSLPVGANDGDALYIQYFIDGQAGGDDSFIYLYTTSEPDESQEVELFSDQVAEREVTLPLPGQRLNVVDVDAVDDISGDSDALPDGFLRWRNIDVNDAFCFIVVESPLFGAVQTLMCNADPN
ncbi:MAG: hypothetical protein ACFCBW_07170 [Candidatus Competibacterales bacterium]